MTQRPRVWAVAAVSSMAMSVMLSACSGGAVHTGTPAAGQSKPTSAPVQPAPSTVTVVTTKTATVTATPTLPPQTTVAGKVTWTFFIGSTLVKGTERGTCSESQAIRIEDGSS